MSDKYVIGVDYGTDSVRAIIVDAMNGNEIASSLSRFALFDTEYYPDAEKVPLYAKRYKKYKEMGAFIELEDFKKSCELSFKELKS